MKKLFALIPLAIMLVATVPVQAAGVSVVALPNPIGIPEVIIVAVLLILASWKKSWIRVITSIGIIIWGAYFTAYDIKWAAPVIAIGVVLFIIGILNIMGSHRAQEV